MVPREIYRRKNGLESQTKERLSTKITQSGMWGDNTHGLSFTGLLRPTDSSSEIRRNQKSKVENSHIATAKDGCREEIKSSF